ncbi:hypothetical protein RB623_12990 [Mesorhizobium sp. LHD-90]|uniref:hypothetical protein n=1 Tax=Mesorhizobium sp. LHD-90 TaxID=3071414 RepID=UPI0027E15D0E|nr:hypothetical protein [Mesorhizobium sp. LHD-90]MDQ6434966.1 hypothetical protein [Mesorhizobium sp. LHD-90]
MRQVADFPASPLPLSPSAMTPPEDSIGALLGTEAIPNAIRLLARSLVALHDLSPRTSALFATQQRWLLCHATLAHHFLAAHAGEPGLTRRVFGHLALRHGIASRNTAHAFFDEALKYEVIQPAGEAGRGRRDEVAPSPAALSLLSHWYVVHFQAFDLIDGGNRTALFLSHPESMLARVQPIVAHALLSSPEIRVPGPLYTIFTWADAGGLLMDRLVAGIDLDAGSTGDRFLTDVSAISHLAQSFGLSRAHASRKLSAAESIGGIGWTGRRGRSPIWISRGFYEEYARAHARKLVILDAALAEAATISISTDLTNVDSA